MRPTLPCRRGLGFVSLIHAPDGVLALESARRGELLPGRVAAEAEEHRGGEVVQGVDPHLSLTAGARGTLAEVRRVRRRVVRRRVAGRVAGVVGTLHARLARALVHRRVVRGAVGAGGLVARELRADVHRRGVGRAVRPLRLVAREVRADVDGRVVRGAVGAGGLVARELRADVHRRGVGRAVRPLRLVAREVRADVDGRRRGHLVTDATGAAQLEERCLVAGPGDTGDDEGLHGGVVGAAHVVVGRAVVARSVEAAVVAVGAGRVEGRRARPRVGDLRPLAGQDEVELRRLPELAVGRGVLAAVVAVVPGERARCGRLAGGGDAPAERDDRNGESRGCDEPREETTHGRIPFRFFRRSGRVDVHEHCCISPVLCTLGRSENESD